MRPRRPRKVQLPGHGMFWFLEADDGHGPLAPLEHCDEQGNVLLHSVLKDGYAQVCRDGRILRYGALIGRKEDLEVATTTEE